MGAWGPKYFDNDDAGDFIDQLRDANDWSIAKSALDDVVGTPVEEYLDLTPACAAVAAAAAFAQKSRKFPASDFPDDIETLDALPPPPDLALSCLQALARVRSENSELAELWSEAGGAEWLETIDALEAAIR